jgi:peptidyl-prolyl cis-trans isomerase
MEKLKTYELDATALNEAKFCVIHTQKGDMKIELFGDDAPQTVLNFATLARDGFYKGLNFHRVIANFVIQGGCPHGTGTGGPGWRIRCECDGQVNRHERGSLSMAHAGRDTGGSQFFICHSAQPHLDGVHTIFGRVMGEDGLKVLDAIRQGDKIIDIEILSKI